MAESILRLATRGSLLARTQSQQVADALMRVHAGLRVELVICTTSGDRITDRPLAEAGGKGLFTKEIEEALLAGRADFAVHSFKDVPVTMPLVEQSNLTIAAVPPREDPRDVLVLPLPLGERRPERPAHAALLALPPNAIVGTGSPRRRCQILALRGDLDVRPIRGNIDTRIRKCREGEYHATILALAGLRRAGLFDAETMAVFDADPMLPAAGQGALALQCRTDDRRTRELLSSLDDAATRTCVDLERGVVAGLSGDCHSPIAVYAFIEDGHIALRAAVGRRDGGLPVIRAQSRGRGARPVLDAVLNELRAQGAEDLLRSRASGDAQGDHKTC